MSQTLLSPQLSLSSHFCLRYLMVYNSVPSSLILSSLLGMVMLWATDFFPLWKKVSGVQILLAIRLLRGRIFMGPWNFNLSSFQLCRKKTSMVYSYGQRRRIHYILTVLTSSSNLSVSASPCMKMSHTLLKNMENNTDGTFHHCVTWAPTSSSSSRLTSPATWKPGHRVALSICQSSVEVRPVLSALHTALWAGVFLSRLWGQDNPLTYNPLLSKETTRERI